MRGEHAEWKSKGACLSNPELFFPEPIIGGRQNHKPDRNKRAIELIKENKAKALCADCKVQAPCLQEALDNDERHGIWGGLTTGERDNIHRDHLIARQSNLRHQKERQPLKVETCSNPKCSLLYIPAKAPGEGEPTYCSSQCGRQHRYDKRMELNRQGPKICKWKDCNNEISKAFQKTFCSAQCREENKRHRLGFTYRKEEQLQGDSSGRDSDQEHEAGLPESGTNSSEVGVREPEFRKRNNLFPAR